MQFSDYQKQAKTTDVFSAQKPLEAVHPAFVAKILGLSGEAGEVAEKFKKIIRDKNGVISEDDKQTIVAELGDVLWYIALIADYLDVSLEEVARANLDKLADRANRGAIQSSGDNR